VLHTLQQKDQRGKKATFRLNSPWNFPKFISSIIIKLEMAKKPA
jgi:hypothetical protein